MIRGRSTTIRDHARKSNHVQAYAVNQFASLGRKYDRGFCINVLSVILLRERQAGHRPVDENQTEAKLLLPVRISYRNSDFTRMQKLPNCSRYDNGFLMNSLRGYSFYGLIPPDDLVSLVKRGGFKVES